MSDQEPAHRPLYSTDPVPDGRMHAKLMDPDWQASFRLCVHAAYDDVREMLIAMRVESADRRERAIFGMVSLDRLRQWLVDTAEEAGPSHFYAGPRGPKDAYKTACRMFATMKGRLDSGRNAIPIQSLAFIHAKLTGEDPTKLVKDAEDLWAAVVARIGPRSPTPPPVAPSPPPRIGGSRRPRPPMSRGSSWR